MPRRSVSMTLDTDNLLWRRAQAGPGRSVSRIVDDLVSDARRSRLRPDARVRSVAGTVDLRNFDPEAANRDVRALFDAGNRRRSAVNRLKRA